MNSKNFHNVEQHDMTAKSQMGECTSGASTQEAEFAAWAVTINLQNVAAGLAHISIPEQRTEQIVDFAKAVFLDGMRHNALLQASGAAVPSAQIGQPTLEGFTDALLAPLTIVRDHQGFFNHPGLPACDEDVRLDKLLGAFGLETKLVDLESEALALDAKEKMSEALDFSAWIPTPPAGDGWMLLQIQEAEDGAYALFARRATNSDGAYRPTRQLTTAVQIGGRA